MRRAVTIAVLTTIAVLPASGIASAQEGSHESLFVGVGAEYEGRSPFGSVNVYAGSPDCGAFTSGSGSGIRLSGLFNTPRFLGEWGLGLRMSYISRTEEMETTPLDPQGARNNDGDLIYLDRRFRLISTSDAIELEVKGLRELWPGLSAGIGAFAGYRFADNISQIDTIVGGDIGFDDGRRQRTMIEGERLTSNPFMLGFVGGGSYELPIGKRSMLLPHASIRVDLLSAVDNGSWRGIGFGGGLALMFDVAPAPEAPVEPVDPVQVAVENVPPRITASIDARALDEEGNTLPAAVVNVTEVYYRLYSPLMPIVYFERGSSLIPQRYVQYGPEGAASFAVDSLARLSPIDASHHALNVIGSRLRKDPGATVTLVARSSRDESPGLSLARAQSVRSYLATTWGVDTNRMAIRTGVTGRGRISETTEQGREEARNVEIVSRSPGIMAPVATARLVRDFHPPDIELDPVYDAEAGVRRWSISVSTGGRVIERYSSDEAEGTSGSGEWEISHARHDGSLVPLVVELVVEDSTGRSVTARDELPLTLRQTSDTVDGVRAGSGRQRMLLSIPGFDHDSFEPGESNRQLAVRVGEMIRDGATVTVTGYRSGTDDPNIADLDGKRAEAVARILRESTGVSDIEMDVVAGGEPGEEDLPEARAFARGVTVLIEQDTM